MKTKSKIAWDNYPMQKHGRDIKKAIEDIAKETISNQLLYTALGNLRHGVQGARSAVWFSMQAGKA